MLRMFMRSRRWAGCSSFAARGAVRSVRAKSDVHPNTAAFLSTKFRYRMMVVWGEMDAFQHLNNVFYYRLCESARCAHFEFLQRKSNLPDFLSPAGVGPIVAKSGMEYKAPITYPDSVTVGVSVEEVCEQSYKEKYWIHSEKLDRVAAAGFVDVVAVDYDKSCRTVMPAAFLEAVAEVHAPGAPVIIKGALNTEYP